MAINKIPVKAFTSGDLATDVFTAIAGQTEFTLSLGATDNSVIVIVNDVVQAPTTDYIVNGTTLTFGSALALNDEVIVRNIARPSTFGTVEDGAISSVKLASNSVSTSKLVDNAITTAKILDSNITSEKLANSGVIANTYGSTSAVPTLTVNDKGQITSAGTVTDLTLTSLNVSGNLTVSGTTTTVNATNLAISDPLIYMATGNSANLNDIGVVGHFNNGTYQHTGLVRDATDGVWKLFSGVTTEPTTEIDFASPTYDPLRVGALTASSYNGYTPMDKAAPVFGYSTTAWQLLDTTQYGTYGITRKVKEFGTGTGATFDICKFRINYGWGSYYFRMTTLEWGYLGGAMRQSSVNQIGGTTIVAGSYAPYWNYLGTSNSQHTHTYYSPGATGGGTDVGWYDVTARVVIPNYTSVQVVIEYGLLGEVSSITGKGQIQLY